MSEDLAMIQNLIKFLKFRNPYFELHSSGILPYTGRADLANKKSEVIGENIIVIYLI